MLRRPDRDSLRIAVLLKRKGFRVIPVNPTLPPDALCGALGERCYPDLASIPNPIEIVDIFRRPEHVAGIAARRSRKRRTYYGASLAWWISTQPAARRTPE